MLTELIQTERILMSKKNFFLLFFSVSISTFSFAADEMWREFQKTQERINEMNRLDQLRQEEFARQQEIQRQINSQYNRGFDQNNKCHVCGGIGFHQHNCVRK